MALESGDSPLRPGSAAGQGTCQSLKLLRVARCTRLEASTGERARGSDYTGGPWGGRQHRKETHLRLLPSLAA